jgi:hypothetical protein
MAAGDRATGTTALSRLYEKLSSQDVDDTLPVFIERLGVVPVQSQSVRFDPRTEIAALTRLITRPRRPFSQFEVAGRSSARTACRSRASPPPARRASI